MNSIAAANGALIVGPGDRGRELAFLTIEKGKETVQRRAEFKQIVLGKWVKGSPAAKPILESSAANNGGAKTAGASPALTNRFIGNGSCKLCHEQIYSKWQETKHAHALETLVAKQEDQNQKCLACHTTGFGQLTGYGKALDGVDLGGVGCEVCHGAGEYHVTTGNRNTVSPQETLCQNCHTTETSPKFVYGDYVKRVH
jgi:predicted CXXCH cytochrome family protein